MLARGFRLLLVEAGEAGAIEGLVAFDHGFGEGVGAAEQGLGLALGRAEPLLGLAFRRESADLNDPARVLGGGARRRLGLALGLDVGLLRQAMAATRTS